MTVLGLAGIVLALVVSLVLRRRSRPEVRPASQGLEALARVNQAVVEDPSS